jgi:uncharacterized membrane protein
MNKYARIKQVLGALLVLCVITVYTCLGFYSGSALLTLCSAFMWLGIIGWLIIFIHTWLTKKEKETT